MRPAPLVAAVERTVARAVAPAAGTAGRFAAAPIVINYSPVVNGTNLDERGLLRVLRGHARELAQIVGDVHDRQRRLAFE